MDSQSSTVDHLIHDFKSPLAALRGAIDLLRQRTAAASDPIVHELINLLERNVSRLEAVSSRVLDTAEIHDHTLLLHLPASQTREVGAAASTTTPVAQAAPPVPAPVSAGGPVAAAVHQQRQPTILLLAGEHAIADDVRQLVACEPQHWLHVSDRFAAIDLARDVRPQLILVDCAGLPQSELAIQVLKEDPDTRNIPLVLIRASDADCALPTPPAASVLDRSAPPEDWASLIRALTYGSDHNERRPHILIVDDEDDIRRSVALHLEQAGYRVTSVSTGNEALRSARQQTFALIVLDLLLPDLDGFAVLGGLRAQRATMLTPIILLSSVDRSHEKVHGFRLGADDYVTKPFSGPELMARVAAALQRNEREIAANPSTRLPGNLTIERMLRHRIEQQKPFAVCYSDLDHFKEYNDAYGFLRGDAVIQQTAHVLLTAIREDGNSDDFVGHVGGDDFVIVTTPDRAEQICAAAIARFDALVPFLYDPATRARGYLSGVDRQGRPANFALLSISIAVVYSDGQTFTHAAEVAQRAVEPKKRAKLLPGSAYVIDTA